MLGFHAYHISVYICALTKGTTDSSSARNDIVFPRVRDGNLNRLNWELIPSFVPNSNGEMQTETNARAK